MNQPLVTFFEGQLPVAKLKFHLKQLYNQMDKYKMCISIISSSLGKKLNHNISNFYKIYEPFLQPIRYRYGRFEAASYLDSYKLDMNVATLPFPSDQDEDDGG